MLKRQKSRKKQFNPILQSILFILIGMGIGALSISYWVFVKYTILIFWNLIAIGALFISYWIFVNPNIYIYTSEPLDPKNPTFTPFIIRNQGYLAIHDVKIGWKVNFMTTDNNITIVAEKPYDNRFSNPNHQFTPVIDPGEEYSIRNIFSDFQNKKFEKMDIAIELSFRPFKFLSKRCKMLRCFVTQQRTDGQWYWFPMPLKKLQDKDVE